MMLNHYSFFIVDEIMNEDILEYRWNPATITVFFIGNAYTTESVKLWEKQYKMAIDYVQFLSTTE